MEHETWVEMMQEGYGGVENENIQKDMSNRNMVDII